MKLGGGLEQNWGTCAPRPPWPGPKTATEHTEVGTYPEEEDIMCK